MILGGLYGAQPVGRELVIRLARHLGAGWTKKDTKIQTLLENTRIFLVPAIDIDGFDAAIPGIFLFASYMFLIIFSRVVC